MASRRTRGLAFVALALALASLLPAIAAAQASSPPPPCRRRPQAEVRYVPMRKPPRLVLGAGIALGVLNLPNIAVGPALFAELDAGWPLDIELSYLPSNRAELSDSELDLGLHPLAVVPFPAGGSRVALSLVQAEVATCPLRHHMASGELMGCGGLHGGVLFAEAEGLIDASDETRPLFGASAYARWRFTIAEPIAVTYSAGLFVPFLRERFGFRNRDGDFAELFQQSVVGGRLDVLLSWVFP